jgi:hypothetical protein
MHFSICREPLSYIAKDPCGIGITRLTQAIVHPLSFASRRHQPSPTQVSKMTADLGLTCLQNFYEEADTNFLITDQVDNA